MSTQTLDLIPGKFAFTSLDLENGVLYTKGIYEVNSHKIVNSTFEEIVTPKDKIRISDDCYPVDNIFGLNIYPATHLNSNQKIYVTTSELYR